ncbi:molecular chaperone GrpE [Andreprevotia lacus DSM 23236]|jgi:molecular chaperone GrpE|uniref:Protein GrpE n=1 Tax=Andreprevotia lacus DSM 23236 TaxID=1121001 RepID=A0A1W1XXW7_9NEIS|nr:nucleotide exchange factor GrpE [Andreprevotia lacus]SMC28809.1 molecular chaperone GrpE [Andreprevotia lacus DSM 23236]
MSNDPIQNDSNLDDVSAVDTVAGEGVETPAVDDQLANALADLDKARQDVLYAKAEMDNVRRRAAEENDKARKFAVEKFARELLSVKDALEMAQLDNTGNFEALKMGVDLTHKALVSAFEKFELTDIAPAIGDKLDPHLHQAISMEPSEQEANTVVRVLQRGAALSGRVLRPAMVIVAAPK